MGEGNNTSTRPIIDLHYTCGIATNTTMHLHLSKRYLQNSVYLFSFNPFTADPVKALHFAILV